MAETQYVMVPVPEELVERVQFHLRWTFRGRTRDVDLGAVDRLISDADEAQRVILRTVAEAVLSADPVALSDVVRSVGLGEHETIGMIFDLNSRCSRDGGPGLTIMPKHAPPGADGRPPADPWLIVMPKQVAERVTGTGSRSVDMPE